MHVPSTRVMAIINEIWGIDWLMTENDFFKYILILLVNRLGLSVLNPMLCWSSDYNKTIILEIGK